LKKRGSAKEEFEFPLIHTNIGLFFTGCFGGIFVFFKREGILFFFFVFSFNILTYFSCSFFPCSMSCISSIILLEGFIIIKKLCKKRCFQNDYLVVTHANKLYLKKEG